MTDPHLFDFIHPERTWRRVGKIGAVTSDGRVLLDCALPETCSLLWSFWCPVDAFEDLSVTFERAAVRFEDLCRSRGVDTDRSRWEWTARPSLANRGAVLTISIAVALIPARLAPPVSDPGHDPGHPPTQAEVRLNGDYVEAFLPRTWPLGSMAVDQAEMIMFPFSVDAPVVMRGCVVRGVCCNGSSWAWAEDQTWT